MEAHHIAFDPEAAFAGARELFFELVADLRSKERLHVDLSDLEKLLSEQGNELMRRLLQGHIDLRKNGEVSEPVVDATGVEHKERRRESARTIKSVFGEVDASRDRFDAPGQRGLAPLDAELNLPPQKATLELQRRAVYAVAGASFEDAGDMLERTGGATLPKRQLEEAARRAVVDFDAFYEAHREADEDEAPEGLSDILVLTMDAGGIPMLKRDLRRATRRKAEAQSRRMKKRLSKGEKRSRKRMATVAAVYTIAPHERSAEDVVADLSPDERRERQRQRPKPEMKRVWASVQREVHGIVDEMFAEALARDPKMKKHWVALVDGNETQLNLLEATAEEFGIELTVIVDLIHVLEYLWKAGMAFEAEGSPELERWVTKRLLKILQGDASNVAGGMRRSATKRKLAPKKRKNVDVCADYLLKYRAYLHYERYLAAGAPIATGVIEGAVRYMLRDRMDITGARWSLEGDEAVLQLRSLKTSGDFDEYWEFHEAQERYRNHERHYAEERPAEITSIEDDRAGRGHLRVVK